MRKTEGELLANQMESSKMHTDPAEAEEMVLYEKDPKRHVARIIFNRPDRLNAMPMIALERIGELVKEAEADDDVKVIIFKGNGPCFGSGADAAELGYYIGYKSGTSAAERRRSAQRQRALPDRNIVFGAFERTIYECLKATVCQIHGYCYGAHLQIAFASDIVVASPDALFTHPAFRYLGPAPYNLTLWIETIGLKKVKELVLSTRPLNAAEAEHYGLVNKMVPKEELEKWTEDYADAIAVMPLDAIVVGKSMLQMHMEGRGKGIGTIGAWIGHAWSTNLRYEPGEWNFMKERRDKGITQALAERDQMVAPYFRLGKARNADK